MVGEGAGIGSSFAAWKGAEGMVNFSRRGALGAVAAWACAPRGAAAQQDTLEDLPECVLIDDESIPGWRIISSLPTEGPLEDEGARLASGPGQFSIERSFADASSGEVQENLHLASRQGRDGSAQLRVPITAPAQAEGDLAVSLDIDGASVIGPQALPRGAKLFKQDVPVAPFLEGSRAVMRLHAGEAVVQQRDVDLAGSTRAWRLAGERHEARLAAVAADEHDRCRSCVMTSVAVGMLGRSDDCFELRQMRRLRTHFPELASVIEAYRSMSREILVARLGRVRAPLILLFYLLIAWPTALLVRLGRFRGAAALYLIGFGVFARGARLVLRRGAEG